MKISGKSIRSLERHIRGIADGSLVVLALTDTEAHIQALADIGFSSNLPSGETVLPAALGTVSGFNANGKEVIRRDLPMETAYRQRDWEWEEWHGRDTVTQSKIVDIPYQRYPRDFVPPPSVELTVATDAKGQKVIISPKQTYSADSGELLHSVNLFLELFGECDLLTEELQPYLNVRHRRVNWEILPPGEYPWERLKAHLESALRELNPQNRFVAENRLQIIEGYKPTFQATGRAGFRGYIVFGFESKGLCVLESLYYGNATYVLDKDWETISMLSKAEILKAELHHSRIIHRDGWAENLDDVMTRKN